MAENTSSNLGGLADGEARKKLLGLREALLRLHKTLLDMERRAYEKEHGAVNTGQLFQLVVDNPQFAWLHNISEFVVRIDADPTVVMQHAELAKMFLNERADT
jgi:hypothetical protein